MELVEKIKELIQYGNLQYLTCYNIYKSINISYLYKTNAIFPLIISSLFILEIILFAIFFYKNYTKITNLYVNKKREVKSRNNISEKSHLIDNDENLISENYASARNQFTLYSSNKYFFKSYWAYLKNKVFIFIFFNNEKEFNSIAFKFIKIIIFILNFLFITALLFNDNYISLRLKIKENELEYVLTKEFRRIIFVFAIAQFINKVLLLFFNAKESLKEIDEFSKNDIQEYFKKIDYLKCCFQIKFTIGFILILILHISIIYYFFIFTYIYRNINLSLLIYLLLTTFLYIIFYLVLALLIVITRLISLKLKKEFIFKISIDMADIFEIL